MLLNIIFLAISLIINTVLFVVCWKIYSLYETTVKKEIYERKKQEFVNKQKNTNYGKMEYYTAQTNSIPECLKELGFKEIPKTTEEIKNKYKELVKIHHPDAGGDKEKFNKINTAYHEAMLLDIYKKL